MSRKTDSIRLGHDVPDESQRAGSQPGLVLLYTQGQLADVASLARSHVFSSPVMLIGRDPEATVPLPHDLGVSGQHAMLRWDEGQLSVADLHSRNGTWLNGVRIQEASLTEGDVLRTGATLFKVVRDDIDGYRDFLIDGSCRSDTPAQAAARTARGFAAGYRMERLIQGLCRAAQASITVALLGETGTGKEVLARLSHVASGRSGAFVAVNCGAIPGSLVESELFGAKRGAYSGLTSDRLGYVRQADGGTLFLDEIGDMALDAQTRLLRVLQEREVQPLGANRPEKVDIRVVCATHQDLTRMVDAGTFRKDLLGRLLECSFEVPPLRQRKEDILPICVNLLKRHGRPQLTLSPAFADALFAYDFPHNVRELESIIKHAVAFAPTDAKELQVEQLGKAYRGGWKQARPRDDAPSTPPGEEPRQAPMSPHDARDEGAKGKSLEVPEEVIRWMLRRYLGDIKATATAMKVSRALLYRLLVKYGIEAGAFRE